MRLFAMFGETFHGRLKIRPPRSLKLNRTMLDVRDGAPEQNRCYSPAKAELFP